MLESEGEEYTSFGEASVDVGFEGDLVFEVGFGLSRSLGLGFQWVEVFL